MFDENYYAEKEKAIHVKYVKSMERLLDDMADLMNRFFQQKAEWNQELREIANNRTGHNEATKPEGEVAEGEGVETAEPQPEGEAEEVAQPEAEETPKDDESSSVA